MASAVLWVVAALISVVPATRPAPSTRPVEVAVNEIDEVGVEKLAHDAHGLQLVTVWATWCAPCVAEMPETADLARQFHGLKWMTISVDEPRTSGRVFEFLSARNITADNYIYAGKALKGLVRALDPADASWDGSPPHTLLIAPGGRILYRQVGRADPGKLVAKIREHLKD